MSRRAPARSRRARPRGPRYELRVGAGARGESDLEVWQLPSPATPHLRAPRRVAGLGGRNLALVEHRVLRQLKQEHVDPTSVGPRDAGRFDISEDFALRLGLAFRTLAPMRNRAFMRGCIEGIEAMGKEEAAYWLGMAMHREVPAPCARRAAVPARRSAARSLSATGDAHARAIPTCGYRAEEGAGCHESDISATSTSQSERCTPSRWSAALTIVVLLLRPTERDRARARWKSGRLRCYERSAITSRAIGREAALGYPRARLPGSPRRCFEVCAFGRIDIRARLEARTSRAHAPATTIRSRAYGRLRTS